ncbi:MAG: hypothetical protein DMG09_07410 [Acidobacteria bacterium]|nr:MAG: hypothetical protein DMG09_07410 [Acidobacteriota bacterium]
MSSQIFRGGALTGLQESVRVVANDINNTLVIQSSAADYAYLLDIIKKLDVLPRQVIIDARIFEVDLTDAFSFGIGAQLQKTGTALPDGTAFTPGATTGKIDQGSGILSASTFAFVGSSREILLALDTLRQKTKVRILEAPSVLALDGTIARIVVGGETPYPGGSFFGGTGLGTSTVQYRDTGISLIVMPRISGSGVVTLDIAQEVSSLSSQSVQINGQATPSFNKSSVATTLAVKDGEAVAIAGLIRDSSSFSRNGVPFFSDIPILGSLFGRTNRGVTRTELLILISPHVIKTPERLTELTQELKDSLRNVRKFVDDKQKEHLDAMEDARKDRSRKEDKRRKPEEPQKESQPPPAKNPKD